MTDDWRPQTGDGESRPRQKRQKIVNPALLRAIADAFWKGFWRSFWPYFGFGMGGITGGGIGWLLKHFGF